MAQKLTAMMVEKLRADPTKRVEIGDSILPGLYLVVQPSSEAKSWAVRSRVDGRPIKITIGQFPAFGLAEARAEASKIVRALAEGRDPRHDRAEREAEQKRARRETLKAAVVAYLKDREGELRPKTLIEIKRHLETHWQPLHDRALRVITRREIADVMVELKARSGPVAMNRARAALSALYAWAIARGLADASPVQGTPKAAEKSRERVLSLTEMRQIWAATEDSSDHDVIVRLAMLLGQRRDEIGGMRWDEIDLDELAPTWTLPGSRVKNGRMHVVPLSPVAVELLKRRPTIAGHPNVFGKRAGQPFSGWSRCKARLDQRLRIEQPWTLHDVRRSLATHIADHNIAAPHIVEAILNHVSGHRAGVAGIYNRARYAGEMRRALTAWGELLLAGEMSSQNVVQLRA